MVWSNQKPILALVLTFMKNRRLEQILLVLLVASVLWRGGKSIDATWILAIAASVLTLAGLIGDRFRMSRRRDYTDAESLPTWIRVCVLFIILWSVVSYYFSSALNYGLDEVLRTAAYLLFFLWVIRLREQGIASSIRDWLPPTLSLTAVVAAIVGMFVYVLQPVMRFTGTFFDARFHTDYWPNAWAEFLLIALPLTLLCILRSDEHRRYWCAAMTILLSALYLSFSRGGMLAFGGEVALFVLLLSIQALRTVSLRRMLKVHAKRLALQILLVLAGAVALVLCLNTLRSLQFDIQSFSEKVTFTAAEGRSSVNERAQFWDKATTMALEKPVTGYGPYSFRFVHPSSMQSVLATSDHPHNAILKMAAERGVPVAAAFVLLFGGLLLSSFILLVRENTEPFDDKMVRMTMLVGIAGVLAHVMIDYNLQFTGIGLPLFVLLAFLAPLRFASEERKASFNRWKVRRFLDNVLLCIGIVVIVITAWEGMFLVTSSLGRHALTANHQDAALRWFGRSHMELFSRDLYLSEASIHLQKNNFSGALLSLDQYQARNAFDARGWKIRGEVNLKSGHYAEAVTSLEKAYTLGSYTDVGILRLLLQAYSQDNSDAYKARKTEFDTLFVAFADAVAGNTHFIALSDNVEELQQTSRLLARLFPTDAERYKKIARDAATHAQKERQSYDARPAGTLW